MKKAAVSDLVEDLGTGIGGSVKPIAEFAVINIATAGAGSLIQATTRGAKVLNWYNLLQSNNLLGIAEDAPVGLSTTTISTNTVEYVATFGAGTGTAALVEAGILNAGSGGTLLCRTVFSVVNKGADDTLTITWTITIN